MFTAEEASKERVDSYVEALEHEREGYEARIGRIKAGLQDPLTGAGGLSKDAAVKLVQGRISQVKAESARVQKIDPVEPSDEVEEDAAEE